MRATIILRSIDHKYFPKKKKRSSPVEEPKSRRWEAKEPHAAPEPRVANLWSTVS